MFRAIAIWKQQTNILECTYSTRNIKLTQKEQNLQFQHSCSLPTSGHVTLVTLTFENGNLFLVYKRLLNKAILKSTIPG